MGTVSNWLIVPGSSFKLARGSGRARPPKFSCVEQEGAAHSPAGPEARVTGHVPCWIHL